MLKKTIKFTNFDGQECEQVFHFNLTKAEIMKMEIGTVGGLKNLLEKIQNERDIPRLLSLFEEIVHKSYGVKSLDGQQFEKSEKILAAFMSTEAYSELFMELIGDSAAAARFINAIVPANLAEEAAEQNRKNGLTKLT